MATVEWRVRADEFANCNCSYGCPCQFNALPTHGFCEATAAWKIHEGHFGDIRLDGLTCGFFVHFPGAVHEGNGTIQLVVDEKADTRQREALVKIMSGEETEEMATMWWVFSAMSPNKLEPLFVPIDFDVDVEGRRARLNIPGLLEASGEPIRNPVTGAEQQIGPCGYDDSGKRPQQHGAVVAQEPRQQLGRHPPSYSTTPLLLR